MLSLWEAVDLMRNFVICINNESNQASLILGKVYPALPDAEAEMLNMIRIIDEDLSEPDGYLYDASSFARVELPEVATKDKRFTCKVCGNEMSWRELKEPQCSLYSCLYCGDLLRQHIYRHIYQYAHTCKVCSVLISSYEPVMDGEDYYHEKCHKIAYPSKYVPPPQQSSVKSEGCFVATLCYSSPDAPEVISLKEFRDKRLKNTWSGRIFVRLYYKCSPYVVSRLRNYPIICQWIRKTILDRIVDWIRQGQEVA